MEDLQLLRDCAANGSERDALGISDDAAQKRVDRALGRMRDYFARRGVAVSAAMLATLLAQHAAQAAPIGMATAPAASGGWEITAR